MSKRDKKDKSNKKDRKEKKRKRDLDSSDDDRGSKRLQKEVCAGLELYLFAALHLLVAVVKDYALSNFLRRRRGKNKRSKVCAGYALHDIS